MELTAHGKLGQKVWKASMVLQAARQSAENMDGVPYDDQQFLLERFWAAQDEYRQAMAALEQFEQRP